MKKIGIIGGTFNPIHNGHLAIAKAAYEQYNLEQVLFLPSKKPPHKKNKKIASNKERMDMVELAIKPYPFFMISKVEMEREGYSYTSDTLKYYVDTCLDTEFYFIIGADSLHYMEDWHNPAQIFSLSHILSAPRFPNTTEEDIQCKEALTLKYHASISFIKMDSLPVASNEIAQLICSGGNISNMLPISVYDYIKEHQLYKEDL